MSNYDDLKGHDPAAEETADKPLSKKEQVAADKQATADEKATPEPSTSPVTPGTATPSGK